MKKWVEKLVEQFDFDLSSNKQPARRAGEVTSEIAANMSEDRATLLYILDTYNKHLIDFQGHPVRKTRESLDEFTRDLLNPEIDEERVLFRLRQFFSTYRVDETAYFHKTFEDFRTIIWDFVDQLAEDIGQEQKDDFEVRHSLEQLKEAVESNSIEVLKNHSRKFIDCYFDKQDKKDKRRAGRMKSIRKNLNMVKKQLGEANNAARVDHLTQAYNRKTFEEFMSQHTKLSEPSGQPVSLLLLDIDHFKKINDTFGHPVGDFVLKELVTLLKNMFTRDSDLVARIGGEEFAILLPDYNAENAMKKAEEVLQKVRSETYVQEGRELRFTVSVGIAQLASHETQEGWLKRADLALYNSKNTGRNKATLAPAPLQRVA